MVRFKSSWPVPLLLGLYFVAGVGPAAAQHPDPWQFPQVTKQQPFRRAWWFFEQRAFPLGYIPLGVRERALQQIEQAEARQAGQAARQRPAPGQAAAPAPAQQPTTQQASAPQTAAAAVQGSSWTNIGPAPIQVPPIPRAVSGRVADIAVHPTNSNHWLIGSAQGGVWQTLDAGATWTPLTDDQASLAMGAIAFAPSDPNIIYAGTGEAVFAGDAYGGAGLLKSTNGGASWQLLASGTFARTSFSDIKVNPANANVLLAATTMGIAGRLEAPPPAMPSRGIFKSVDGGLTWSQTLNGEATDLEADPTDFNRVYGAIGSIFGGTGNGVYRSANAGDTWTLIQGPWSTMAGGVGRVEMAIAPSNPNVLYISIHATSTGGLLGLFRTDNAWAPTPAFIQIDTSPTGPQGYCAGGGEFQCWYDHEIVVDPVDPNVLYAGGIGLWKCTNCGASPTWSFLNPVHSDQQTMAWAGGRLIVGSDGGVWSTTDGGATWNDHNTSLSITQFYAGSLHPTDPSFALGGSQDNGTEKWTGLDAWQFVFGGDGSDSAISSTNPDTHWLVTTQDLGLWRTTDAGASFTIADSGIDRTQGFPFLSRLEKCPAKDDVVIVGTVRLWRSDNFFTAATPTWVSNGPSNPNVTALAFYPGDATCSTYAFVTGLQLWLTINGGVTWVDLDPTRQLPSRYITNLAFDPSNPNILYATMSGFDEGTPSKPGHVFRTTNALAASPTWVNVSPPVNLPHNTVVVDPMLSSVVYVGTDLGVWRSEDSGASWTHFEPTTGMPNVAVFDLRINSTTNRLVAFTHGRGAFALNATSTMSASITSPANNAVVSATVTVSASVTGASGTSNTFKFLVDGAVVNTQTVATTTASFGWNTKNLLNGSHTLAVNVTDATGATATSPTVTVTVNNQFAIFITAPTAGTTVSGTNWVVIWWEGAQSAPPRYTITVAGQTVVPSTPASNPQPTSLPWDTTRVSNGPQTITVTAVDGAGRTATASVNVTVSNMSAAITSPANGTTVSGTVSVGMSVTGASGSSNTFRLSIDGTVVSTQTVATTTASFSWNTKNLLNGTHTLSVTVTDATGASATSPTVSVTVSNAYAIFITAPTAGTTVSGTNWVVIWWEGAQTAPPNYTVTVAGVTVVPSTPASNPQPTSLPWDTRQVPNGPQTITVTGIDGAGRTATASVGVTVSNP